MGSARSARLLDASAERVARAVEADGGVAGRDTRLGGKGVDRRALEIDAPDGLGARGPEVPTRSVTQTQTASISS